MKTIHTSGIMFTLSAALFLTLVQNTLFMRTIVSLLKIERFSDFVFIASIFIAIFLVINIFLTIFSMPYLRKPILSALLLIGPVIVYYMYAYNILIDTDMVRNVFQTDTAEASDLISFKLVAFFILTGLIPAILVYFVKIKPEKSLFKAVAWRLANILASLLIITVLIFVCYKDAASFFRNNKWVVKQILPSNYIGAIYNMYADHVDSNRVFIEIGGDAEKSGTLEKPVLFVIVVGETARNKNFSLGGYERNTNPLLSAQENLFYFTEAYSCNTSTAMSLPCMFSDKPRAKFNVSEAKYRGNVIDIVYKSGSEVLWVENDGGCKGVCDRIPTIDTRTFESPLCNGGVCFDEVLLPSLDSFIDNLENDGVIVLHTIGSHGPTYYKRYPDEYEQFTPACKTNILKNCETEAVINTYDNTLLYTDAILNSIIEKLQASSDKFSPVMLYVSDHGESLGEGGLFLHATPYMIAPKEQTNIPLMIWVSENYAQSVKLDKRCITNMRGRELSHDNLFHTILGIMGITAKEYDYTLDILGQCKL